MPLAFWAVVEFIASAETIVTAAQTVVTAVLTGITAIHAAQEVVGIVNDFCGHTATNDDSTHHPCHAVVVGDGSDNC